MSKAKPWPTVANRHRVDAIMKAGEITTEAEAILVVIRQLRDAVRSNNTALARPLPSFLPCEPIF